MSMNISQNGINELLKTFEGCRLTPYQDEKGLWTIGWGHKIRPDEHFTQITQDEADDLMRSDLKDAEDCVNEYVTVPISQNQFDALVSFAYNVGIGNFEKSTLLKLLNNNQNT